MRRAPGSPRFNFIRPGLALLAILLAVYIPLRIYLATSDQPDVPPGTSISLFVTTDLAGYREPCG
ncbi:MAG: hypothetical protein JW876_07535 [Candidatus Krumholzibacteriota bacterium]|nr:hypothetical protein [Candidatus Krumholzibacteriota bacterium]